MHAVCQAYTAQEIGRRCAAVTRAVQFVWQENVFECCERGDQLE